METLKPAEIVDHPDFADHEGIWRIRDESSGLKALIAVHDRSLGPALGGCRLWRYETEHAALTDVLRLSRGMTYKNALAGLEFGGGKAVIYSEVPDESRSAAFSVFGLAVAALEGQYITAEDVGVSASDMDIIADITNNVRGITASAIGNPSPYTALGVYHGIVATLKHRFGVNSPHGVVAAVQGLGSVGYRVAELLHKAGAKLILSDLNQAVSKKAAEEFEAAILDPNRIHAANADVFVPCALGGGLSSTSIPEIKAGAVAGAANNQLATPEDAAALTSRGILYAPDFAINAGGVIAVALDGPTVNLEQVRNKIAKIGDTLSAIFERADSEKTPTAMVADKLAEERLLATRSMSAA